MLPSCQIRFFVVVGENCLCILENNRGVIVFVAEESRIERIIDFFFRDAGLISVVGKNMVDFIVIQRREVETRVIFAFASTVYPHF